MENSMSSPLPVTVSASVNCTIPLLVGTINHRLNSSSAVTSEWVGPGLEIRRQFEVDCTVYVG